MVLRRFGIGGTSYARNTPETGKVAVHRIDLGRARFNKATSSILFLGSGLQARVRGLVRASRYTKQPADDAPTACWVPAQSPSEILRLDIILTLQLQRRGQLRRHVIRRTAQHLLNLGS